ncbi:MAG: Gfo/Idh/MocA family oxidoreductase [Cytophagales bacterium]|nr:Gfo/Idh/MocA family oxidoreductase [Cytophagales bacterium]
MPQRSRRKFIKKLVGTSALAAGVPGLLEARPEKEYLISPNETSILQNSPIRLGAIGMGIMGYNNIRTALMVPGAKLVAVCDLYDGHLESSRENFGSDLFTTRKYKELLDRDDIDAVVVSTSDHWHDKISIAAMKKGKAVYCEKPMVHKIEEGAAVIKTEQETGQVFQVGSQRVSSIIYEKAGELYRSGAIGDLVLAETFNDRFSRNGAWQYSIPTDASEKSVDWKGFLGDAPKRGYDAKRFFRWRNYQDYGTGVAGDLFVHLFSGLHVTLGSKGPNKIYASGGLRYWEDGRDVPDVMLAVIDYNEAETHPAFNLQIRVNFVDSSGGGSLLKLVGTEGTMTIGWNDIRIKKNKIPDAPGYGGWDTFGTFTEAQQADYEKWYKAKYPKSYAIQEPGEQIYRTPEGYSDHLDHWTNFFESIRNGKKVVEDASFGLRAAGPSLATNVSLFEQRIVNWDPEKMELI